MTKDEKIEMLEARSESQLRLINALTKRVNVLQIGLDILFRNHPVAAIEYKEHEQKSNLDNGQYVGGEVNPAADHL